MHRAFHYAIVSAGFTLGGCSTDVGTGLQVMEKLKESHPITVGKLVAAYMDGSRLRIYLSACRESLQGPVCGRDEPRLLAMIESGERQLLERLAERYLIEGREKPLYIYGPMCDGLEEMVVVPRCQTAIALGVWDPYLNDYIVYSTLHGANLIESEGVQELLEVARKVVTLLAELLFAVAAVLGARSGRKRARHVKGPAVRKRRRCRTRSRVTSAAVRGTAAARHHSCVSDEASTCRGPPAAPRSGAARALRGGRRRSARSFQTAPRLRTGNGSTRAV